MDDIQTPLLAIVGTLTSGLIGILGWFVRRLARSIDESPDKMARALTIATRPILDEQKEARKRDDALLAGVLTLQHMNIARLDAPGEEGQRQRAEMLEVLRRQALKIDALSLTL